MAILYKSPKSGCNSPPLTMLCSFSWSLCCTTIPTAFLCAQIIPDNHAISHLLIPLVKKSHLGSGYVEEEDDNAHPAVHDG
jgi:hypothetical protein